MPLGVRLATVRLLPSYGDLVKQTVTTSGPEVQIRMQHIFFVGNHFLMMRTNDLQQRYSDQLLGPLMTQPAVVRM